LTEKWGLWASCGEGDLDAMGGLFDACPDLQKSQADCVELCSRDLVDVDYPDVEKVRVVMDNLSTHTASAVYQTFPAHEARRILRRLEFHYTPRHASWLNMAEIEIGVMRKQCLDQRIDNRNLLETEVDAWQRRRTESGAQIRWKFSTENAREKMAKSYPTPSLKEP
jgi:hypothetical protein